MTDLLLYYLLIGCFSGALMHQLILWMDNEVNLWEGTALVILWPFWWAFTGYHFLSELLKG